MKNTNTRFAPSLTGYLTSANLRTALYNYLLAKKNNSTFKLRIEDTDEKRFHEKSFEYLKAVFEWCNIEFDESPWNPKPNVEYYQSKRDYSKYINKLLTDGKAYYAFDSSEELKASSDKGIVYNSSTRHLFKNSFSLSKDQVNENLKNNVPYVIRIVIEPRQEIILKDLVKGNISFNTSNIDEKVLVKSSGMPTYHLAHVADDYDMGTTHVLRGDEWIPSYPIHHLLWEYLELPKPEYLHMPLILNPDGKGKLSKRTAFKKGFEIFPLECSEEVDGELKTFKGFKALGYEPLAYLHFLAQLGHNFTDDADMDGLIEQFDISKISKSPAIFNVEKLTFINRVHLLKIDHAILWNRFPEIDTTIYDSEKLERIMVLALERANTYLELKKTFDIFFDFDYSVVHEVSDKTKTIITEFYNSYNELVNQTDLLNTEISKKELRAILTNQTSGADLSSVLQIISHEDFFNRIKKYLNNLI